MKPFDNIYMDRQRQRQKEEEQNCMCISFSITVCYCLISLILFFSLFFPITYGEIEERDRMILAECTNLFSNISNYNCCEIESCKCLECGEPLKTCTFNIENNKAGRCCGNSKCCKEECSQCCHKTCYPCLCHCAESVDAENCNVICGYCYNLASAIKVRHTSGEINQYLKTEHCGLNNTDCVSKFEEKWIFTDERKCYWDPKDEDVHWKRPTLNQPAVIFAGIFGVLGVVLCLSAMIGGILCCMSETNSDEKT